MHPQPNPESTVSRRRAVAWMAGLAGSLALPSCASPRRPALSIACFRADVTPPAGIGMMGGAWLSKFVADPLEANGFILFGAGRPIVFVSVDWCEIRNDAYGRWQSALAEAVGSTPERVMISTIHQHDTPVADLEAERILRDRGLAGTVCALDFHERAVQSVAKAARVAARTPVRVTEVGMGQAKVERVASNRRYRMPDGQIRFDRMSSTRNVLAIEADEGLIDPWLKTLSFWNGDRPLAAASFYAVHPMSHYGQGAVSADFPGIARRTRQAQMPGIFQIYASGCSGNLTAGKYNTGAPENRPVLAERLRTAMEAAWRETRRVPIGGLRYSVEPLRLEPREHGGFSQSDLEARLNPSTKPFHQCLAAMGLSWRRRVAAERPVPVPVLDFGVAAVLLLPGEAYIEYQLAAQQERPGDFICVAGYGDGATGYIPTEAHWAEHDSNLGDWCWVAPGSEARMREVIRKALHRG